MRKLKDILKRFINFFGVGVVRIRPAEKQQDGVTLATYYRYYPAESIRKRRFYNLGAGNFRHECWTNIDKISEWYKGVQDRHDVIDYDFFSLDRFPLGDESAELFYTSHAIEHVTDQEVSHLFSEVWRALKPGGLFRITCPNIDLDYRAYLNGDADFFYFRTSPVLNKNPTFDFSVSKMSLAQAFLWHVASNVSVHHVDGSSTRLSDEDFDYIIKNNPQTAALDQIVSFADREKQEKYPGNHINWFNPEKLEKMLYAAGFKNVSREAYGQSKSPVMRDLGYFDVTHPKLSLYVEAEK